MPIKKHVLKVGKDNTIALPSSLCGALGIGEGSVVRVYSNSTGYQCVLETLLSYENTQLLEQYKEENAKLKQQLKEMTHGNL